MEEIPKVPVYLYPYTRTPTHFIKIYDYREPIEPFSTQFAYYTLCCTLGRKENFYKHIQLVRIIQAGTESLEPVYYIAAPLAAKLINYALTCDIPYYITETSKTKAIQLAQDYTRCFETYAKKKWAINYIQKIYLENYYNPKRPFCIARLLRDLNRLQTDGLHGTHLHQNLPHLTYNQSLDLL